ncbi:MAG: hypothetical protein AB1346_00305 [Thermodesulfobacteriota bacterium]
MKNDRAAEGIRFAGLVARDPAPAVRRWKVLTGRMAVGCPPFFPVPEIVHCVGMLPVMEDPGGPCASLMDARVAGPEPVPEGRLEALDWIEELAERAEALSGERCTEGRLWKSLRAYVERDGLLRRLERLRNDAPGAVELRDLVIVGRYLAAEMHAVLLEGILGFGSGPEEREERGDPFLLLADRVVSLERRIDR